MASFLSAHAETPLQACVFPPGVAAEAIAQQKLTRLLELRAVIDSLRCEHESRDPLLSWVISRERPALHD